MPEPRPDAVRPAAQPPAHPVAQPAGQPVPRPAGQPRAEPVARPRAQPAARPAARPAAAPTKQKPSAKQSGFLGANIDVFVGAVLMLLAAMARVLPTGPRAAITLPVLLVVPGYLLIQALRAGPRNHRFGRDLVVAAGISLPVVGLLALITSVLPGGFRPGMIVGLVTVASLAMAAVAAVRRRRLVFAETPSTAAAATD